jgi:methionyl-tRNA formyltransferase
VHGELVAEPQDESLATQAPLIHAEHRRVDFRASADAVANLVRGMAPSPGAFTFAGGKRLRLVLVREVPSSPTPAEAPGTVHVASGVPEVVTGRGSVEIVSGQLEGKRVVTGRDLVNGRVLQEGLVLGS